MLLAVDVGNTQTALGLYPDSRLLPLLVIVPGIGLAGWQLAAEVTGRSRDDSPGEDAGVPEDERARLPARELAQFGVVALYLLATLLLGFHVAGALFVLAMLTGRARMRPWRAALYTVVLLAALDRLAWALNMRLPVGWLAG